MAEDTNGRTETDEDILLSDEDNNIGKIVKILQREYRKNLKENPVIQPHIVTVKKNVPSIKLILMIHMLLEYNKNKLYMIKYYLQTIRPCLGIIHKLNFTPLINSLSRDNLI